MLLCCLQSPLYAGALRGARRGLKRCTAPGPGPSAWPWAEALGAPQEGGAHSSGEEPGRAWPRLGRRCAGWSSCSRPLQRLLREGPRGGGDFRCGGRQSKSHSLLPLRGPCPQRGTEPASAEAAPLWGPRPPSVGDSLPFASKGGRSLGAVRMPLSRLPAPAESPGPVAAGVPGTRDEPAPEVSGHVLLQDRAAAGLSLPRPGPASTLPSAAGRPAPEAALGRGCVCVSRWEPGEKGEPRGQRGILRGRQCRVVSWDCGGHGRGLEERVEEGAGPGEAQRSRGGERGIAGSGEARRGSWWRWGRARDYSDRWAMVLEGGQGSWPPESHQLQEGCGAAPGRTLTPLELLSYNSCPHICPSSQPHPCGTTSPSPTFRALLLLAYRPFRHQAAHPTSVLWPRSRTHA